MCLKTELISDFAVAVKQRILIVSQSFHFHWKAGFESFPMVYDTPILSNTGLPYTVGKLSNPAFQWRWKLPETSRTCECMRVHVMGATDSCLHLQPYSWQGEVLRERRIGELIYILSILLGRPSSWERGRSTLTSNIHFILMIRVYDLDLLIKVIQSDITKWQGQRSPKVIKFIKVATRQNKGKPGFKRHLSYSLYSP